MREQTKKHFDNILNTMSGEDGGVRFVNYMAFITDMDERAEKGDIAAERIIVIMERFSRMLDIAQKRIMVKVG